MAENNEKKHIQVILIETFTGKKYVLRMDREYEKALLKLLRTLFKQALLGSVAHISLRNIEEEVCDKIKTSGFMEGIKDGKDNKKNKR